MLLHKPIYYKKIGTIDINPFILFLEKNANFKTNNSRDRKDIFKNCKTFFIIECGKNINPHITSEFMSICQEIGDILNLTYGKGCSKNIQYSLVPKNTEIEPHDDYGDMFEKSHRIHIPLITNENVLFNIEEKSFHFSSGEVIEINNLKSHSVQNNSNFDRIHLIIDYTPSYIKTLLR